MYAEVLQSFYFLNLLHNTIQYKRGKNLLLLCGTHTVYISATQNKYKTTSKKIRG